MRPHPRSAWLVVALAALTLQGVAFGHAQDTPAQVAPRQVAPRQVAPRQVAPRQVAPRQVAPRQVIDVPPVYVSLIGRDYPNLFPPPVQARREGWLRKWSESKPPDDCLALSGTLYYLERGPGDPAWLAAVVETEYVPELELEVHLEEQVAISGTAEFFSLECSFPRLHAHSLEVVDPGPDTDRQR